MQAHRLISALPVGWHGLSLTLAQEGKLIRITDLELDATEDTI
ncbi:hypothetical protein X742_30745 [Mesorhizobium sp. LNHC232B00]|nr:hypothetical protein X742_30745 [Mesorhizobium sp. LNHC232B00]